MHCMGKGGELRVPEQPAQALKPRGDAGTQGVWGQDSTQRQRPAGTGVPSSAEGKPRDSRVLVSCALPIVHTTTRVRGFETSLSVRIVTTHIWNSRTEGYYLRDKM